MYQPIQSYERVQTLDIIRGLCLLGILMINVFGFFLPMPYIELSAWYNDSPFELMLYENISIYIQGSIYPLFAMLFGYGVALQYKKATAKGVSFYSFAPRRFTILLIIGVVHGALIWWGDILFAYAVCAFVLLGFIRFRARFLFISALLLNSIWQLYMLFPLGYFAFRDVVMDPYVDIAAIEHVVTAYTLGSWSDTFMQRAQDFLYMFQPFMWLMTLLPYMLIGAAAGKWQLVERARSKKFLWFAMMVVTLGSGIYSKSLFVVGEGTYLQYYVQTFVGGPLLAIGYASALVLLCTMPVVQKLCKPFASIGRLSMTMYLMQSIVLTTLSYQYGAGLYGKLSVQELIYIAVGMYVLQVVVAELYLTKFSQGPIEMIWKKFTYKKIIQQK